MNDTTAGTPKQSWWQRLKGGLKRTSSSIGTAVADLVTKRKLDSAMLDDIEDVLLRADLGTDVAVRIAEAVGKGRYDKAISADEVKGVVATEVEKVLAPVVGPDAALIWFGVMLCVNMQTSFLHPPFGFALFYLRGVAPKEVKSSDIYWGAMPWIGLQAIMVALVIAFPVVVTGLLDKPLDVDLNKVKIEVPQIELPQAIRIASLVFSPSRRARP